MGGPRQSREGRQVGHIVGQGHHHLEGLLSQLVRRGGARLAAGRVLMPPREALGCLQLVEQEGGKAWVLQGSENGND